MDQITCEFKYKLGQFVKAKPFYEKGNLITPATTERYKVIARMYTEGIIPDTTRMASAIVYNVELAGGFFAKKQERIRTVQEKDIMPAEGLIDMSDLGTPKD